MKFFGCCAIFLAFLVSSLNGQEAILWNKARHGQQILDRMSIYKDENKLATLEDIISIDQQGKFLPSEKKVFSKPLDTGVYWFKLKIANPSNDLLILELAQAILPYATLYSQQSDGSWTSIESGYKAKKWHEKSIKHHNQDFYLCSECSEFYLRLETFITPIDIKLWEKSAFERKTTINQIIFGIILGLMLFVIMYNLFLFYTIRRLEYFLYCLLILGYLGFSLTISGNLVYYFPSANLDFWFRWIPIILQPIGLLYAMIFLEVEKHAKIQRWVKLFLYYFFAYWLLNTFLSVEMAGLVNQINALIGMGTMITIGFMTGKRGHRFGYYFGLAYILMWVFGVLDILYIQFGSPAYFFDVGYIVMAFLFEVIILSYLLTKRLEWENKAAILSKEETQQKLVDKTIENERIVKDQNIRLESEVNERTAELKRSIEELKQTQAQLIHSEKMASLGELTAGIAHEIQNPLNFVNNFSEVSTELLDEMSNHIVVGEYNEAQEIAGDLKQNLQKITHHGKRAGDIVKSMLQHSRSHTGLKELTDLNALADEYLRLAYHGLRAKDKSFNASIETDFDPSLDQIALIPQEMGRVLLNLITNAFYAVNERSKLGETNYKPQVDVSTKGVGDQVRITVSDNGIGIPEQNRDKIFQPFFTTKPTGQGTGLGLSLSYDIITKGHGGQLEVQTKQNEGTSFIITLTR